MSWADSADSSDDEGFSQCVINKWKTPIKIPSNLIDLIPPTPPPSPSSSQEEDLKDLELKCRWCKATFLFTGGEQKFFKKKNFTQPKQCKKCRTIGAPARHRRKKTIELDWEK